MLTDIEIIIDDGMFENSDFYNKCFYIKVTIEVLSSTLRCDQNRLI